MKPEARRILLEFRKRNLGPGGSIAYSEFGEMIEGDGDDQPGREGVSQLLQEGYVVETNGGLQLTHKGFETNMSGARLRETSRYGFSQYLAAQRALADLKAAALQTIIEGPGDGMTLSEIGVALGLGAAGPDASLTGAILALMAADGVVEQDPVSRKWIVPEITPD